MEIQMNVPYAIEILARSPLFKIIPLKEKIELARQYCIQWRALLKDGENKKNKIKG